MGIDSGEVKEPSVQERRIREIDGEMNSGLFAAREKKQRNFQLELPRVA